VIKLLRAFGATVSVTDPFLTADEATRLGVSSVELDALLQDSNIVTLHAPLLPETQGLLGERELGLLPDGALLINSARGALVDGDSAGQWTSLRFAYDPAGNRLVRVDPATLAVETGARTAWRA
jgi:YD repeat-containing protein